jgi:hypothetical protein
MSVPGDGCWFPRVAAVQQQLQGRRSPFDRPDFMLSDEDESDEDESVDGDFFASENTVSAPLRP